MRMAVLLFITLTMHCSIWASDRIVSLDPGVTEILVAMNKEQYIIATDSSRTLENTPVVGYYRQIAAEGLLSTQPSMVVANQDLGPKTLPQLIKNSGAEFIEIEKPKDIKGLSKTISLIGKAIECPICGTELLAELNKKAVQLEQPANQGKKRAVLLLMTDKRNMRIAGKGTGGDSLLELIGTTNLVDHSGYRPISMEGLLALQPELILITSRSDNDTDVNDFSQQWPGKADSSIIPVAGEAVIAGVSLTMVDTALRIRQTLSKAPNKNALR